MPDLQLGTLFLTLKVKNNTLCLLLDASLNISTSHVTSSPSVFEAIFKLTRYTNYLLIHTYLLRADRAVLICILPQALTQYHGRLTTL